MKKPDSGLIYVHIAISFNRNILDMWNDQEIEDFFSDIISKILQ